MKDSSFGLHQFGQCEERDAGERHVELAPGGDAVKIAHIGELRQCHELLPVQSDGILDEAVNLQFPFVERHVGADAKIEHWKVVDLPLAGREAILRTDGGFLLPGHLARPSLFGGDVGATHVFFKSFDGYATNNPLDVCMDDDVLVAHSWNGQPLTKEHGGPARVIIPKRYAWKGAKFVRDIQFIDRDILGFWEVRGYSNTADPWREDRFA